MQPSSGHPLRARSTKRSILSVQEVRMTVDSHQRPSLSCDFSARRLASGLRDDERLPKG
jgi:hypothetical protein